MATDILAELTLKAFGEDLRVSFVSVCYSRIVVFRWLLLHCNYAVYKHLEWQNTEKNMYGAVYNDSIVINYRHYLVPMISD